MLSKITLPLIAVLFLSSCVNKKQIKKIIKENPDIIADAIRENPTEIMTALQDAAMKAREEMAQKREQDEKKELEGFFDKPLEPEIPSNAIVRGNKNGPITLVEYSDFECPFCARGYNTVTEIMKKYEGKVRFIYKHLPLRNHPNAMPAALYFEAIALQSEDKAWKFHDKLFDEQRNIRQGAKFFDKVAKSLGVNMAKLKKDVESSALEEKVNKHMAEAERFGIQGTPGFVINGIPVKGAYPVSHFEDLLNKLKEKGKLSL